MGLIAKVLSWTPKLFSGDIEADPGGGAAVRSQLSSPSGVDAPPMEGDYSVLVPIQGTGRTVTVGNFDAKNESLAKPGEHRIYARDGEGAPVVSLHLKNDGSAVMSNSKGSATLGEDGSITLQKGGATVTIAADESLNMLNGSGGIGIAPDGVVTINGVTFSTTGDVSTGGKVEADDVTATNENVTLSTHEHNNGNVAKPDPGT